MAQPKKVLNLDEAGDLGRGLLRLLFSVLDEPPVVSGTIVSTFSRERCGGGDFRDEAGKVLITVVRLASGSGELGSMSRMSA